MIDISQMDSVDRVLVINELAREIHETARSKGFYDIKVPLPQALCLIHSEVTEAMEAHRAGEPMDRVAEELADVIIRVLDTAAYHELNIGSALVQKMEKNKGRQYKHGKRY